MYKPLFNHPIFSTILIKRMSGTIAGNNLVLVGAIIGAIYFVIKFLEMRFVDTESQKPMKVLIRDTIVVCISSIMGVYVLDQFKLLDKMEASSSNVAPSVFVDTPGF